MKYSLEEKTKWVENWRQSGKNAWTFAKENGLVPQTFSSWVKPRTKRKMGFVEVSKKVIVSQLRENEIVLEKGEIKIHIPLCLNSIELQSVIQGIKAAL
jgi:transposase-like protein